MPQEAGLDDELLAVVRSIRDAQPELGVKKMVAEAKRQMGERGGAHTTFGAKEIRQAIAVLSAEAAAAAEAKAAEEAELGPSPEDGTEPQAEASGPKPHQPSGIHLVTPAAGDEEAEWAEPQLSEGQSVFNLADALASPRLGEARSKEDYYLQSVMAIADACPENGPEGAKTPQEMVQDSLR